MIEDIFGSVCVVLYIFNSRPTSYRTFMKLGTKKTRVALLAVQLFDASQLSTWNALNSRGFFCGTRRNTTKRMIIEYFARRIFLIKSTQKYVWYFQKELARFWQLVDSFAMFLDVTAGFQGSLMLLWNLSSTEAGITALQNGQYCAFSNNSTSKCVIFNTF